MTIGVYQIRNMITGACYIGASSDIEARWKAHCFALRSGRHVNPRLQRDWTHYGEDAFEFTVIEEVDSHDALPERERHHADHLLQVNGVISLYSDTRRTGVGLMPQSPPPDGKTTQVAFHLSPEDIERWRIITKRRYPRDTRRMSQVIRELIREEDARGKESASE